MGTKFSVFNRDSAMDHLNKTLTMVSMEPKVVSEDSFLDKLSEKVHLNGF